jgi:hypothetical protein
LAILLKFELKSLQRDFSDFCQISNALTHSDFFAFNDKKIRENFLDEFAYFYELYKLLPL